MRSDLSLCRNFSMELSTFVCWISDGVCKDEGS